MQETLYIENFGPIKKATLDLRQAMVFIGPQSSGKSTIAKLIAIMRDWRFVTEQKTFQSILVDYNIDFYNTPLTRIEYKSHNYSFVYTNTIGSLKDNNNHELPKLQRDFEEFENSNPRPSLPDHSKEIKQKMDKVRELQKRIDEEQDLAIKQDLLSEAQIILFEISEEQDVYVMRVNKIKDVVDAAMTYSNYSRYIPAERILISLYSGSALSFLNNDLPIPKSIVEFGDYFQKARAATNQLIIPFLLYKFLHKDGEDFIVTDNFQLKLKDVSSGLQALVPLVIVVNYLAAQENRTFTYVIEEPEQNLYPLTQKDLVYYLTNKCLQCNDLTNRASDLIITTHSPYTLTSFNNLLFAHQVAQKKKEETEEISKIIAQESWVNPDEFNSYFVADGTVRQIFNRETGLIDENELDSASEEIMGDFGQLMEIYKGIKA